MDEMQCFTVDNLQNGALNAVSSIKALWELFIVFYIYVLVLDLVCTRYV